MNVVYAETPQNANPNQFPRFKDSKFVLRKLKAAFTVSKVAHAMRERERSKNCQRFSSRISHVGFIIA